MARGVFRDGGVVVGGKLEELKNFGMVFGLFARGEEFIADPEFIPHARCKLYFSTTQDALPRRSRSL
jgi:hypothetical protein